MKDLYLHQNSDASSEITNVLEKNWKYEIESAQGKHKRKPSLYRAIRKTFFRNYMLKGLAVFLQYVIIK